MYPASKITSKYIAVYLLIAILLLFPFKDFIANILVSFSDQRLPGPKTSNQIQELEKKNVSLSLKLKDSQLLQQENEKLKKALEFKTAKNVNLVGCEIISFDPSSWRRLVIVDIGKDRGLKEGMYALNQEGYLVGRIVEVKKDYSRLMLVDDPEFSLPVFIGDSAIAMLKGGLDSIKLLYIDQADRIKINDFVWFRIARIAEPIYIGRATKIKENKDGLFFDVEMHPFSTNLLMNKIFIVK